MAAAAARCRSRSRSRPGLPGAAAAAPPGAGAGAGGGGARGQRSAGQRSGGGASPLPPRSPLAAGRCGGGDVAGGGAGTGHGGGGGSDGPSPAAASGTRAGGDGGGTGRAPGALRGPLRWAPPGPCPVPAGLRAAGAGELGAPRAAAASPLRPRRPRGLPGCFRAADGAGRAAGAGVGAVGSPVPGRAGGLPLPAAARPAAAAARLDVPGVRRHAAGRAGHHGGVLLPAEHPGLPGALLVPAAAGQDDVEQPLLPLRAAGLPARPGGRRPLLVHRRPPAPAEAQRPRAAVELHPAARPDLHRLLHRGAEEAGRRLGGRLLHELPGAPLALRALSAGAVGGDDQPAGGARRGAGARPLRRLLALLRRHAAARPRLRHLLPLHELAALQHRHVLLHHAGQQRALLRRQLAPAPLRPLPAVASGGAAQHRAPPAQPRLSLRGRGCWGGAGGASSPAAPGGRLHAALRGGAALPALLPLHHPGLQQLDQRAVRLLVGHDGALALPPARQDHVPRRAHRGGGLPQAGGVHAEPALEGPRGHAEAVLDVPQRHPAALQHLPAPALLRHLGLHQRALPAEAGGPAGGPGARRVVPVAPHALAAAAAAGAVAVARAAAGAGERPGRTHGRSLHRRLPRLALGELRQRGFGQHQPAGAARGGAGGAGGAAPQPQPAGGRGAAGAPRGVPQGAHGVARALLLHVHLRQHHGAGAGEEPDAAAGAARAGAERHRDGAAAPRAAAHPGGAAGGRDPDRPSGGRVPAAAAAPGGAGAAAGGQPRPAPPPLPPQEILPLPAQRADDPHLPAQPGAGPAAPGAAGTGGGLRQLARRGRGGDAARGRGAGVPRALSAPNKVSFFKPTPHMLFPFPPPPQAEAEAGR